MENRIIFFSVGNGDTTLIQIEGLNILIDFYHNNIPLIHILKRVFKVDQIHHLLLTHADKDHVHDIESFIDVDKSTLGTIPVNCLYVPAAMLIESERSMTTSAMKIKRYAKKIGSQLTIVSQPKNLKKDDYPDAQYCTAGDTLTINSPVDNKALIEIFIHNPSANFYESNPDRNQNSLAFLMDFKKHNTTFLNLSDSDSETIYDIYRRSLFYQNTDKLLGSTIFKTPHHISYKSVVDMDDIIKDKDAAKLRNPSRPHECVDEIVSSASHLVSSSKPIGTDPLQGPPHKNTAHYYDKNGSHLITSKSSPYHNSSFAIIWNLDDENFEDTSHYQTVHTKFKYDKDEIDKFDIDIIQSYSNDEHSYRNKPNRFFEMIWNSRVMRKHEDIYFEVDLSNLSYEDRYRLTQCTIYWQVTNFGEEAKLNNSMRGTINHRSHLKIKENTSYKGIHWVEAFFIEKSTVIARTGVSLVIIE